VDENGHGTRFFGGCGPICPPQTLPFSIIPDPGPGGKSNVLAYNLGNTPNLVGGDVVLVDSDGLISDLLRFDPVTAGGTLFFYSAQDAGIDAIADIGLPTGRNTNVISLLEEPVLGGGFGAHYTPNFLQGPGYGGGADTYYFLSDPIGIPEPASLFLLLTGGAVLLGLGVLRGRI
jgi:hypothetical protein